MEQFELAHIQRLFEVTDRMLPYARRERSTRVLEGAVLGNLFFEPSTRSRLSFGAAFNRLGGYVRETTGFAFSSMAKGESVYDTSRVVSGYMDILVVRHPEEGAVAEFAAAINVPVINGGDGPGEHPTQALLDLYTLCRERGLHPGGLGGMRIAVVGDLRYGRTVHSLTKLLALESGLTFVCVAPEELQIPDELVLKLRQQGHTVELTDNLAEGIRDVDVIYATRVQQERLPQGSTVAANGDRFRIDAALYDKVCRPGTVLMHPLPRDSRGGASELADDLNSRPELAIFRQTDNGIPVRMALFALVLDVADQVADTDREARWYRPERFGVLDTRDILS
ncbi:aspartate carbamoyltransferase [Micromonospora profundi]|uniref:Aspartate carbamoyltransferase n=1 Tax=Micromonospora profundi TaxID=1420889 RepID=A0AAJ6HZB9_9ACTN|nr:MULTISPECIES: aspartate carbamoyltransferase [Micromonospora]NJC15695.1 aspartate carbamoyltransferase catalytic subunit [Micromonospora profundi]WLS47154.1 aspartate carbamoyltransferase [Micromonospora profundi]